MPSHTVKSQPSRCARTAAKPRAPRNVRDALGWPRLRQGQDSERLFPSSTQSSLPRRDATNSRDSPRVRAHQCGRGDACDRSYSRCPGVVLVDPRIPVGYQGSGPCLSTRPGDRPPRTRGQKRESLGARFRSRNSAAGRARPSSRSCELKSVAVAAGPLSTSRRRCRYLGWMSQEAGTSIGGHRYAADV